MKVWRNARKGVGNKSQQFNIMTTIEIYQSPNKDANEANGTSENSCVCCGKPIKVVKQFIHVTTDWAATDSPDTSIEDSQGLFPIGNECKKHFPKEFIFNIN